MHLLLLAAAAADAGGSGEVSFVAAMKTNPWFLGANVVTSAIVLTIVVERFIFQVTKYRVNSKEFFAQIKKLVAAGNIDRAIKLCEASDFPILQLVKAGLTHANKGPDEIDAALSEKLSDLKPAAEKRIAALWSLANIATLTGLIGTISGLIGSFKALGKASPSQKAELLSKGISEAMNNTAFGLSIAVICIIGHLLLTNRSKSMIEEMELSAMKLENLLARRAAGEVNPAE